MQFPDFTPLLVGMFVTLCIGAPLAVWKLVELIIWACQHISISFGA